MRPPVRGSGERREVGEKGVYIVSQAQSEGGLGKRTIGLGFRGAGLATRVGRVRVEMMCNT